MSRITIRRRQFPRLVRKEWHFDPAELRDQHGRWSGGGALHHAEQLLERAARTEPKVTGDVAEIARSTSGSMAGVEFRLKGRDSLARKIESDAREKKLSHGEAASKIKDVLRYTTVYSTHDYATGVREALADAKHRGYKVEQVKNYWGKGDAYNGINAVLRAPDGHRFEWQFHTPESLETKEHVLHPMYERHRVSRDARERYVLTHRMRRSADRIPEPARVHEIGTPTRQGG